MLILAAAALAVRALLEAASAALLAVSDAEVQAAAESPKSRRAAHSLLRLRADGEATTSSLRLGSALCLAVAVTAGAIWAAPLLAGWTFAASHVLSAHLGLAALIAALALLLELGPRSLASVHPLEWGLALSSLVRACAALLSPLMRPLLKAFDALLLPRGAQARFSPPPPPLEQIERILSEEKRDGQAAAPSAELVHGLFSFAGRTAKEVMVPRIKVSGIPLSATPAQVIELLAEEGHTRLPVYDGDLDHIVGVLHAKDIIPLLAHPELIVLQDLLRPPLFVPWAKPVDELLREMQQKRSLLALVHDEHGGFLGIVTLEDILEEIVGEIRDEHDVEAPAVHLGSDGTALVRAETRVEEINRSLGANIPEDAGYETLAGLLNACAGAIPAPGDRFYVGGLELTVVGRDERRVRLVRLGRSGAAVSGAPG